MNASHYVPQLDSSDNEGEFPAFKLKPDPDPPAVPDSTTGMESKPAKVTPRSSPQRNLATGETRGSSSREPSPQEWYDDVLTSDCETRADVSGKFLFLLELLQEAGKLKEKVLVFTQSLLTLDLIEELLSRTENGEWTPGLDYYRLDGSTRSEMRTHQMSDFNEQDNEQ